jgi:hypothetical protein
LEVGISTGPANVRTGILVRTPNIRTKSRP